MAKTILKGLIGQEDLALGTSTFTRSTSTGGTITLHQIALSGVTGGTIAMLTPPVSSPPIDSDFSWVNQNGATTTTDSSGLVVLKSSGTGDNVEARFKSGTTAVVGFVSVQDVGNQGLAGL